MITYNLSIEEALWPYNNDDYRVIRFLIHADDGAFQIESGRHFITVSDGTTQVSAFQCLLSGSKKILAGLFTTDAFDSLPTQVDLSFGVGGKVLHTMSNVDIDALTEPLPPYLAALNAPDADNAWLATI
jgi:hypothetical protein